MFAIELGYSSNPAISPGAIIDGVATNSPTSMTVETLNSALALFFTTLTIR